MIAIAFFYSSFLQTVYKNAKFPADAKLQVYWVNLAGSINHLRELKNPQFGGLTTINCGARDLNNSV
jgi:hypothetical protein